MLNSEVQEAYQGRSPCHKTDTHLTNDSRGSSPLQDDIAQQMMTSNHQSATYPPVSSGTGQENIQTNPSYAGPTLQDLAAAACQLEPLDTVASEIPKGLEVAISQEEATGGSEVLVSVPSQDGNHPTDVSLYKDLVLDHDYSINTNSSTGNGTVTENPEDIMIVAEIGGRGPQNPVPVQQTICHPNRFEGNASLCSGSALALAFNHINFAYICRGCRATFENRKLIEKHINSKHWHEYKDGPFVCKECLVMSASSTEFKRHVRDCHKTAPPVKLIPKKILHIIHSNLIQPPARGPQTETTVQLPMEAVDLSSSHAPSATKHTLERGDCSEEQIMHAKAVKNVCTKRPFSHPSAEIYTGSMKKSQRLSIRTQSDPCEPIPSSDTGNTIYQVVSENAKNKMIEDTIQTQQYPREQDSSLAVLTIQSTDQQSTEVLHPQINGNSPKSVLQCSTSPHIPQILQSETDATVIQQIVPCNEECGESAESNTVQMSHAQGCTTGQTTDAYTSGNSATLTSTEDDEQSSLKKCNGEVSNREDQQQHLPLTSENRQLSQNYNKGPNVPNGIHQTSVPLIFKRPSATPHHINRTCNDQAKTIKALLSKPPLYEIMPERRKTIPMSQNISRSYVVIHTDKHFTKETTMLPTQCNFDTYLYGTHTVQYTDNLGPIYPVVNRNKKTRRKRPRKTKVPKAVPSEPCEDTRNNFSEIMPEYPVDKSNLDINSTIVLNMNAMPFANHSSSSENGQLVSKDNEIIQLNHTKANESSQPNHTNAQECESSNDSTRVIGSLEALENKDKTMSLIDDVQTTVSIISGNNPSLAKEDLHMTSSMPYNEVRPSDAIIGHFPKRKQGIRPMNLQKQRRTKKTVKIHFSRTTSTRKHAVRSQGFKSRFQPNTASYKALSISDTRTIIRRVSTDNTQNGSPGNENENISENSVPGEPIASCTSADSLQIQCTEAKVKSSHGKHCDEGEDSGCEVDRQTSSDVSQISPCAEFKSFHTCLPDSDLNLNHREMSETTCINKGINTLESDLDTEPEQIRNHYENSSNTPFCTKQAELEATNCKNNVEEATRDTNIQTALEYEMYNPDILTEYHAETDSMPEHSGEITIIIGRDISSTNIDESSTVYDSLPVVPETGVPQLSEDINVSEIKNGSSDGKGKESSKQTRKRNKNKQEQVFENPAKIMRLRNTINEKSTNQGNSIEGSLGSASPASSLDSLPDLDDVDSYFEFTPNSDKGSLRTFEEVSTIAKRVFQSCPTDMQEQVISTLSTEKYRSFWSSDEDAGAEEAESSQLSDSPKPQDDAVSRRTKNFKKHLMHKSFPNDGERKQAVPIKIQSQPNTMPEKDNVDMVKKTSVSLKEVISLSGDAQFFLQQWNRRGRASKKNEPNRHPESDSVTKEASKLVPADKSLCTTENANIEERKHDVRDHIKLNEVSKNSKLNGGTSTLQRVTDTLYQTTKSLDSIASHLSMILDGTALDESSENPEKQNECCEAMSKSSDLFDTSGNSDDITSQSSSHIKQDESTSNKSGSECQNRLLNHMVDKTPIISSADQSGICTRRMDSSDTLKCFLCRYEGCSIGSMREHCRVHVKLLPYSCSICKYKSHTKKEVRHHIDRHHGPKASFSKNPRDATLRDKLIGRLYGKNDSEFPNLYKTFNAELRPKCEKFIVSSSVEPRKRAGPNMSLTDTEESGGQPQACGRTAKESSTVHSSWDALKNIISESSAILDSSQKQSRSETVKKNFNHEISKMGEKGIIKKLTRLFQNTKDLSTRSDLPADQGISTRNTNQRKDPEENSNDLNIVVTKSTDAYVGQHSKNSSTCMETSVTKDKDLYAGQTPNGSLPSIAITQVFSLDRRNGQSHSPTESPGSETKVDIKSQDGQNPITPTKSPSTDFRSTCEIIKTDPKLQMRTVVRLRAIQTLVRNLETHQDLLLM